jgi:hypothetical protein
MVAVQNIVVEMALQRTEVHLQVVGGDAFIARARNTLFMKFMEKDFCSDIIMLDDDVRPESGAVARILSHPVDIVAGLYPARRDPEQYLLRWAQIGKAARPDKRTGLLEVDAAPTGFFRISRKAAKKMAEAYSDRWYKEDESKVKGGKALALFTEGPNFKDRTWWGEDFSFCHLWNALGGKVWIDPWLKFGHIGLKEWTGCFGTFKQKERLEILQLAKERPEKLSEEMHRIMTEEPVRHTIEGGSNGKESEGKESSHSGESQAEGQGEARARGNGRAAGPSPA